MSFKQDFTSQIESRRKNTQMNDAEESQKMDAEAKSV